MSNDLATLRRYAQGVITEKFPESRVEIDECSSHERSGEFFYRLCVWIDNRLCVGSGESHGKAVDDTMCRYDDYDLGFDRYVTD